MTESRMLWETHTVPLKRFQNRFEWSAFKSHFVCGLKTVKVFCEHPFTLQRQQPEKDEQNVNVAPWKTSCRRP